jgi:SSS family solute:Na+ symporter
MKRLPESFLTRAGMAVVTLVSIVFAVFVPSVVDIYYTIGTLAVPGLLLPVLSSVGLVPRVAAGYASLHLVAVPLVSSAWYLAGRWMPDLLPPVEAFYPGCMASALIWGAGLLASRPQRG